jgi:anti-sigma factor RsiW
MVPMDCNEARTCLLDRQRGTLEARTAARLDEHMAGCAACRHDDAADRTLSAVLEQKLPQYRAPVALRRSLEARWADAPVRRERRAVTPGRTLATLSAGAVLACLVVFVWRVRASDETLVAEVVNDHLRVLYDAQPLEIASGGIHQVKPWFEGRLDFAPIVDFAGDDEFPLEGGAVAYVIDRKAAAFLFKHKLHRITLFVFRASGLSWQEWGLTPVGSARGAVETNRGFHVVLWRQGDLGYALVSDVNDNDLLALATRISTP